MSSPDDQFAAPSSRTANPQLATPHITILEYDPENVREFVALRVEDYAFDPDKSGITWVDVDGTEDVSILQRICSEFNLPSGVLADVETTIGLRPKIEDYGSHLHIVLRMMRASGLESGVVGEVVHLLLGTNFVVSVQGGEEGDVFDPVRARIRDNKGSIRRQGPDYLIYALFEAVLDNYFSILEEIGEAVEDLQDEMLESPSTDLLRQVRDLKRTVRFLRKSIWPMREVISLLEREDSPLVNDANNAHFRRAYEHSIQVMDVAEAAREVLSDMLDIYLSSISNRLNQVMKTLTVFTAIFMPLTLIAGIYGMNFKYMPELNWTFGYPLIVGGMAVIGLALLAIFKYRNWI